MTNHDVDERKSLNLQHTARLQGGVLYDRLEFTEPVFASQNHDDEKKS